MRIFLFLFTFFAGIGLVGPTAKEAAAQCTHLGALGACPVGIPNGSNSVSFNANGTINWSNGGISGPCCAQPSGTETGGGLLNLNNALGGNNFHFGPTVTTPNPNADPFAGQGIIDIVGGDFLDVNGQPVCSFGSCSGDGLLGQVFGASPNSGYQCDSGGPGCGNDIWVGLPQPGFGACGPGGCTGAAPIVPLTSASLPGTGPYSQNSTFGQIDPFGGGSSFQDPITGEAISISDDPEKWPKDVKHADKLNSAYVNGKIPYPFDDPNWRNKSEADFKSEAETKKNALEQARDLSILDLYNAAQADAGPSQEQQPTAHTVQSGENLFRLALRYGIPVTELARANGIQDAGQPLPEGTEIKIPSAGDQAAGGTSSRGPKYSDKTGRFGIGADTSLGGVNGLSARFQVAKNFGVQAIVSFVRVNFDTKDANADLTGYVSTVVTAIDASSRPQDFVSVLDAVTPQPAPKPETTSTTPRPTVKKTVIFPYSNERGNAVDRREIDGKVTYRVSSGTGRVADFDNRADAISFSNRLRYGGQSFDETVRGLPDDQRPIPDRAATTNPIDAIRESIPSEFQAPTLTDRMDGEIHDIYITDPKTGQQTYFKSRTQAEGVLDLMRRDGLSVQEARARFLASPTVTPDGLASATSAGNSPTTSSTPAPAGSAPSFTNNRPAIIVPPTPPPTRPKGTTAGNMKALLNGEAYDIEVIKTPDGKMLAVGTGENAGHVFGEVKEPSNKLFGGFRREGPWTAPPAKTTDTATATPTTQTPAPQRTPSPQTANTEVRSQIANSDREHMLQTQFTDGFESGDVSPWRSTLP